MSFSKLGLCSSILKALDEQGYSEPTPVQSKTIPVVLSGKDAVVSAQTGTGKTASFVLPILERLNTERTRRSKRIRALVLVPTRELAMQVESNIQTYAKHLELRSMVMVGGLDSEPQKQALIDGVDILVATPGRLLDLAHQRALYFDELEFLVLDEADRMLDMGFIGDINKIIDRLPKIRQNLLFSATLSKEVKSLAKTAISNPVEISISANKNSTPKISQWLVAVDKEKKSALISHLISDLKWPQALIFIRTKAGAAKLVSQLEKRGISAESIHSGRSQSVRSRILEDFKSGKISLLVATGVAARGIDIEDLSTVVNYDLPDDVDDYIHRIGRTGRAGASGEAVSLVSRDDFKRLCAVERKLGQEIERRQIPEFMVLKDLPESDLNYSKSAHKPKHKPQNNENSKTKLKPKPKLKSQSKPAKSAEVSSTGRADPWAGWGNKR
ncbi:DEAD/DEAH box helicase [Alginatibacterium sediminis]|uniref:DEAD-box ATP-dependent RNA helicase RhpA n=1 Tax=Alginatibacterium sediminis TaxID=2164068 RepID=A0A420EDK1_9ALTE|nr:DEAD/DEAH box helicase [Alginatibacterium sediminis]RKF18751.1 DEAD/DEAH box helicase [Alginatibacterium sediminis]